MSYVKKPSVVKIDPTVTHLQPDQFDNDGPIQNYPFGTSAMRVTTATGFPETSGDVITSRTTDDTGSQIFIGEKAYIRTFEASAWSSWRELGEGSGGGPVEWDDILNKPSQFPPSPHTHDIEDIIGLQAALNDKASAQSVNELQQEVDEHKEETTQNAHLAKNIGIEDTAGNFASTNVEGALAELFQFANDGKTAIASAITSKGVPASPTETFTSLAEKIGQISTGVKWASGTGTATPAQLSFTNHHGYSVNLPYLQVSYPFGFVPRVIVIYRKNSQGAAAPIAGTTILYPENLTGDYPQAWSGRIFTGKIDTSDNSYLIKLSGNAYVNLNGFRLPVTGVGFNVELNWIAFE